MDRHILMAATVGVIAAVMAFGCPDTMAAGLEPNPKAVLDTLPEDNTVYFVVEDMPEYKDGGELGLRKYISDNLQYPQEAKEQGIGGTAYVQFIVEKDGKVSNVELMRTAGNPLLDAEAVRVVSTVQDFIPGMNRRSPVRVQRAIPIKFSTEDTSKSKKD